MDSREFQNVGIFSDQSRETPDFLEILALLMTNILYCSSHEFFIFWLFYLLKALQNVDRFQRIQQERWHISNKVLFVLHIWIVTKKKNSTERLFKFHSKRDAYSIWMQPLHNAQVNSMKSHRYLTNHKFGSRMRT